MTNHDKPESLTKQRNCWAQHSFASKISNIVSRDKRSAYVIVIIIIDNQWERNINEHKYIHRLLRVWKWLNWCWAHYKYMHDDRRPFFSLFSFHFARILPWFNKHLTANTQTKAQWARNLHLYWFCGVPFSSIHSHSTYVCVFACFFSLLLIFTNAEWCSRNTRCCWSVSGNAYTRWHHFNNKIIAQRRAT